MQSSNNWHWLCWSSITIQLVKTNKEDSTKEKLLAMILKMKELRNYERVLITNEIEENDLKFLKDIDLTSDFNKLIDADVYLVTVPTLLISIINQILIHCLLVSKWKCN